MYELGDFCDVDPAKFIQELQHDIDELPSTEEDQFGVFPITNRGIQIWLLLRRLDDPGSVFEARLPCRSSPLGPPVAIKLASWKDNYYRHFTMLQDGFPLKTLQFRSVYLRYQDMLRDATFEIDDSAMIENGFTYCGAYPLKLAGNTLILTNTDPLCIKVYSDHQSNSHVAVGYGKILGQHWVHLVCGASASQISWNDYAQEEYKKLFNRGPEHAQHMAKACPRDERYRRVLVKHTCLPGSSRRTVRISCVVWESSRICAVKMDIFHNFHNCGFRNDLGSDDEWSGFNIDESYGSNCDMRGLMIQDGWIKRQHRYLVLIDRVSVKFSPARNEIKLGDYGHFTKSKHFRCEGNVLTDLKSHSSKTDTTPRQHKICEIDGHTSTHTNCVTARESNKVFGDSFTLYKPFGLSLPSHDDFYSLLTSLSTQLTNGYLVTRVIQCAPEYSGEWTTGQLNHTANSHMGSSQLDPNSGSMNSYTPLCIITQPFVWQMREPVESHEGRLRDKI